MHIELQELAAAIRALLAPQMHVHQRVAELLKAYAPEKTFRSTDYVGALGEVYAKLLFGGSLVDDSHEHDLVDNAKKRVSVKTRRGSAKGWAKTSAIPTIEGNDGPDALVFVSLHDDYTPRKIWRYDWATLVAAGRIKEHKVRGQHRSFVFFASEKDKAAYVFNEPQTQYRVQETAEAPEPVTLDLARVREYLHGAETPAYRIMNEMNRVLREEGMDGHRGAPRALLSFVEQLVAHCRA